MLSLTELGISLETIHLVSQYSMLYNKSINTKKKKHTQIIKMDNRKSKQVVDSLLFSGIRNRTPISLKMFLENIERVGPITQRRKTLLQCLIKNVKKYKVQKF